MWWTIWQISGEEIVLQGVFQDLTTEVCSSISHGTQCTIHGPRIMTQYIHSTVCTYFHIIKFSCNIQEYFCKANGSISYNGFIVNRSAPSQYNLQHLATVKTGVMFLMYTASSQWVWALRKHCPEWAGTGTTIHSVFLLLEGSWAQAGLSTSLWCRWGDNLAGGNTQKPHSSGKSESPFRLCKGSPSGKALLGMCRQALTLLLHLSRSEV